MPTEAKLTKDQVREWMAEHGYTISFRAGDWSSVTYMKEFADELFALFLTVDLIRGEARLSATPGFFELTSGSMQFPHPNFEQFFEKKMAAMMFAIETSNYRYK